MQSKTLIFPVLMALVFIPVPARAQSGEEAGRYTLQVAAFPDRGPVDDFISRVERAGEMPFWGTVELPGRGQWTRVFIGSFATIAAARRYGELLVGRGTVKEFFVRQARETRSLSRPRMVAPASRGDRRYETTPATAATRLTRRKAVEPSETFLINKAALHGLEGAEPRWVSGDMATVKASAPNFRFLSLSSPVGTFDTSEVATAAEESEYRIAEEAAPTARALPEAGDMISSLAGAGDPTLLPRPDPVRVALSLVANEAEAGAFLRKGGGLRLGGDLKEGLDRLRWIAGPENASAILADTEGRAMINTEALARASGASGLPPAAATLVLVDYISSNDGFLLLVQMIYGSHNYLLHIGSRAPTAGAEIDITGSLNLDNNFDSRINPYRRLGRKLDRELPPGGFDAMIAINPVARWFNLHSNQMVPVGNITFHELAESHAKVALGLNYLGQALRPGAHNVAIERERRLKAQRPFPEIVLTTGSNRVLRSPEEIRRFTSGTASVSGQR